MQTVTAELAREVAFREAKHEARAGVQAKLDQLVELVAGVRAAEQAAVVDRLEAAAYERVKGQEGAILKECISNLERLGKAAA